MNISKEMVNKLLMKFRENEDIELMEEVSNNREIMLELMKKDIFAYRYASLDIRSERNLALKVLKRQGILLDSVAEDLRNDEEVVLTAVSSYGYALAYASNQMKNNRQMVITAIKNCPRALCFASQRLREDRELINLAFTLGGPFIIEYKAFKCFQKINSNAYLYEKSTYFKQNKLYEYCSKFSDGRITGCEMMEFQEMLLKRAEDEFKKSQNFQWSFD